MRAITRILIIIMLIGSSGSNFLFCQKKAPIRVYLQHFRKAEGIQLTARVLIKTDKRYLPAAGIKIALYESEITETSFLGTLLTGKDGTGKYTLNEEQFQLVKDNPIMQYFAVIDENEAFQYNETKLIIKQVKLDVIFIIEDSLKQIHVHVFETDSLGINIPQKGVYLKLLVERPLSPLPLGDEYNKTDQQGNVTMIFPDDLPGDENGYLKVIVSIIENEDYGTIEVSEIKQWGIPIEINDDSIKRSLWASSANAPISLIILVNALIAVVWGILFFVVIKVFQIRKIGAS